MLLQQLVAYRVAGAEADQAADRPYSRLRAVRWELNLDTGGHLLGIVDLADASSPRTKAGQPQVVPNAGRTSGLAPCLGVDDVQYVLGWADTTSTPGRVAHAHATFVALCQRWAHEYPHEPAAQALAGFYQAGGLPDPPTDLGRWSSKDLVVVVVDGRPVTDLDCLWDLWATVVAERKSGTTAGRSARRGLCLVCGSHGILLDRLPQALPQALVPGAERDTAVVSANKRIHTYDFTEGLAASPICTDCGQAAVANLAAVLADRAHTFTYAGQRTRLAWWITGGADDHTIALLDDNPTAIADYLHAVATGMRPRPLGTHTFCSVTVSGNVSRLVVHDWLEMPLPEAEQHVQDWFNDHQITRRWSEGLIAFPVWWLVLCAGRWQPDDSAAGGHYIKLGAKAADRPDDLAAQLLHAALHAAPLPPRVAAHIVRRIRTDSHVDQARAALLRAALTRHPHRTGQGPTAVLDESQDHPAYLYGRLFAVLEALQHGAYPKDQQPGTSFFHRYFAGAVANPRIALTQGMQMYPAWLKKLDAAARPDNASTPADAERARRAATAYRARLRALHERLTSPARPLTSSIDQSWFVLGYFHQQAHDQRAARAAGASAEPDIDPSGPSDSSEGPSTDDDNT